MKHIADMKSKGMSAFAVVMGTVLPQMAFAADINSTLPSSALDENADITSTVGGIINVILAFLGIAAVVLFLYGGFLWMTAGGNEENVAKAKKIITATVIGLVIILISAAAVNFILGNLVNQTGASINV